jgi:hypothetical protein
MSAAESSQPGHVLPTAPAVVREQPGGETMRAIVLEKFGGLDSLVYTDIPKPVPKQPKSAASNASASSTRVRAESSRSAPKSPH